MAQYRLDALLVQQGIASGRDQAKAYILSGQVMVDGHRVDKAGALVADTAQIVFVGKSNPFVSRGGLKLAKALAVRRSRARGKTMSCWRAGRPRRNADGERVCHHLIREEGQEN